MFIFVVAGMLPFMIWMERKVAAYIQDRRGPNRSHILGIRLFGLVHNINDVIKLFMKEDTEPDAADKALFRLAPFIVMTVAILTMAVVPFGPSLSIGGQVLHLQIATLDVGILYIFAISSLGVYGIVLAGWSSGNKFSFLGAMRASSQMVSYEIPLALSVIGILIAYNTTNLSQIVISQTANPFTWGIFLSPIGFIVFIVCLYAETNRNPFDAPEGESEIVAGFHIEYSSLKFALFFMGEYVHMIVGAAIISTLFFGGWQVPFLSLDMIATHAKTILSIIAIGSGIALIALSAILLHNILKPRIHWGDLRDNEPKYFFPIALASGMLLLFIGAMVIPSLSLSPVLQVFAQLMLSIGSFCAKTFFFSFLFIWVRWTLPRFRYDQIMRLGWLYLLPLGIANIFITLIWARIWLKLWG
jgi:NADH-quinone oxidoreductase subunit H